MRSHSLETDLVYVKEMIKHAEEAKGVIPKALKYGIPLDDDMVIATLAVHLGQIGEQASQGKLSEAFKEKYSDLLNLSQLKGFRNLAYHNYGKLNGKMVIGIEKNYLPTTLENLYQLKFLLEKELSEE
ncbi:antitoxin [Streptococcus pluranimalium]|uniref:DUF86 domain-containing protein n=1 Tax=Streptococcus pluranimalium TaxID=82348 RepID=A0A345VMZ9_9STRE|nr:antitoxin [Streptococcus pluranimalium]AXJ14101.1 hypothetical protein Sp14A_22190 [Streptococcus pluranimalium]